MVTPLNQRANHVFLSHWPVSRCAPARNAISLARPRAARRLMFRNKQVLFYESDVELVGILTRIANPHRRMVL